MSFEDDHDVTPPPHSLYRVLSNDCKERHQRTNASIAELRHLAQRNHERLLVLVGEDGKGGIVEDVKELQKWKEEVRGIFLKLAVAVVGAALVGGGIVAGIMKAMH